MRRPRGFPEGRPCPHAPFTLCARSGRPASGRLSTRVGLGCPPLFPPRGLRPGVRRFPGVGGRTLALRLPRPAPPRPESGEDHAGTSRSSSSLRRRGGRAREPVSGWRAPRACGPPGASGREAGVRRAPVPVRPARPEPAASALFPRPVLGRSRSVPAPRPPAVWPAWTSGAGSSPRSGGRFHVRWMAVSRTPAAGLGAGLALGRCSLPVVPGRGSRRLGAPGASSDGRRRCRARASRWWRRRR